MLLKDLRWKHLTMHQNNSVWGGRTESSERRKDRWLKKRKLARVYSSFLFFSQGIYTEEDPLRRIQGWILADQTWNFDSTSLPMLNLDPTDRPDDGKLIWRRKHFCATSPTNWIWIIYRWKTAFMRDQVYNWELSREQYSTLVKHIRKLEKRFSSAVASWTLSQIPHWLVRPKQDDMQTDLFLPSSS